MPVPSQECDVCFPLVLFDDNIRFYGLLIIGFTLEFVILLLVLRLISGHGNKNVLSFKSGCLRNKTVYESVL